ncbi:MAG: fumarylacetoacetate hydrolase family protein [Candidatus Nanopelagicales bacterium]|jgi:2-keto-4-pentenoate hydratase
MSSDDPRIGAGLHALARSRDRMLAAGASQVGWKIGFGSPSGLDMLSLDGPLVGVLLDVGSWPAESPVHVEHWTAPVVECEVVATLGADIPPGTPAERIFELVDSWAPGFEFADVDIPPRDVVEILAGNIFHRSYTVGDAARFRSIDEVEALSAQVDVDGVARTITDLTELTGAFANVIARAAELAPSVGRPLLAGDIIFTGSIVPPIPVRPGADILYALSGFAPIRVVIA